MTTTLHPELDRDAWDAANEDASLIVCDGPSITINVIGGCLEIKDGPKGNPRIRRYGRVPRKIKHIILLQRHGYISLSAMAWMDDAEITWVVVDSTGRVPRVLANSGRYVNPRYTRRQALCGPGGPAAATGIKIVQGLITRKLEGQARNASEIFGDETVADEIRAQIPLVQKAGDVDTIRGHEGKGAVPYWGLWQGMEIPWQRPRPIRAHWLTYPKRESLRHNYGTNRNATDPVNAMFNFAYFVAETECTLACYASTLSPSMGLGHVDRDKRNSFALDLIEVIRPRADVVVRRILNEPLDKNWFQELPTGKVRCRPTLTHRIAADIHLEKNIITRAMFEVVNLLDTVKLND